jgi:hypothetical protein
VAIPTAVHHSPITHSSVVVVGRQAPNGLDQWAMVWAGISKAARTATTHSGMLRLQVSGPHSSPRSQVNLSAHPAAGQRQATYTVTTGSSGIIQVVHERVHLHRRPGSGRSLTSRVGPRQPSKPMATRQLKLQGRPHCLPTVGIEGHSELNSACVAPCTVQHQLVVLTANYMPMPSCQSPQYSRRQQQLNSQPERVKFLQCTTADTSGKQPTV